MLVFLTVEENVQPPPSPKPGRWGPPPSVHVRYVVVDGLEGEELAQRQSNAIRDVLKFLADQEQAVGCPGDSVTMRRP
ncbi:hypothetical protein [Streptomyces sp. NPDC002845]